MSEVEERCAGLARREQLLRARGTAEWPDGTVAARYGFIHALYQEVVYERVTAGRRVRLHQRIGERRKRPTANGRERLRRSWRCTLSGGGSTAGRCSICEQAGENAIRRSAYQEAISLLTKGLELLKTLPDTPERTQQELALQIALGTPLIATKRLCGIRKWNTSTPGRESCAGR